MIVSVVIFDAGESESPIENILKRRLEQNDKEIYYFTLKDMNILPCRSCGACSFKSPGKCVFDDDIHTILRAFARSNLVIMITPIRFGGYCSQLKKAVDKFAAMGLPLYFVKEGRLLHPLRYDSKPIVVIGVNEKNLQHVEEPFRKLVMHNALNMLCMQKTLIFKSSDEIEKIEYEIDNVIKEVYAT